MRRKFSAVALLCAFLLSLGLAPLASASAPVHPPPAGILATGSGQSTSFFFGANDLITPIAPVNETSGQTANALGVSAPRFLISNVGRWSVTLKEEGMTIEGLAGLSIWASSDAGASNVRFIVHVQINGNDVGTVNTERKATLGADPEEFRADAGSSQLAAQTFPKGAQVSFMLQYSASSSPAPIGPSADSIFHYYSDLYRSRLDIITNPFNLTVDRPSIKVGDDEVNVTTIVKDAFAVPSDDKTYSLSFNGPTNSQAHHVQVVNTIVDPVNGTQLVWNWNFLAQGLVTGGTYTITISAQYIGSDVNYTNISTADLAFPKGAAAGKGLPGLEAPMVISAVALLAVAAWARTAILAHRRSR